MVREALQRPGATPEPVVRATSSTLNYGTEAGTFVVIHDSAFVSCDVSPAVAGLLAEHRVFPQEKGLLAGHVYSQQCFSPS